MGHDERVAAARRVYAQLAPAGGAAAREPFPPPGDALAPDEFPDRLADAALQNHPRLRHPFAVRLVAGRWTKRQTQEWVRQDYQRIIAVIRRHALLAANVSDYETVWELLTRVKAEADVDPVGGTFFSLPQLWIKFGIALGLSREEIVESRPHPGLALLHDAMISEARFSAALPVCDVVDAALDPVFYRLWGEALERTFELPREALDFFWAMAADRWGEETGRTILARRSASPGAQAALWNQYRAEAEGDREWDRLSLLQTILDSALT
ncbi:MAG: hypothetical protein ACRD88_12520 [Terriglobia bacterium]